MPIPILVAVAVAVVSAVAGAGGAAVYKNSKHNKEKKRWQDEKYRLQAVIEDLQRRIVDKQKQIKQLYEILEQKEKRILVLTTELNSCDKMIDTLEKRQSELESSLKAIIAFIIFRYSVLKEKRISNANKLKDHHQTKIHLINEKKNACGEIEIFDAEIVKEKNKLKSIQKEENENRDQLEHSKGKLEQLR